jgi:hypothetical protein
LGDHHPTHGGQHHRHLPHGHPDVVVQPVRQRQHPGAQPVRRRAALISRDFRVRGSEPFPAGPALTGLQVIRGHDRGREDGQIGYRHRLDAVRDEVGRATVRAGGGGDGDGNLFGVRLRGRCQAPAELPLTGSASRLLRLAHALAGGEWSSLSFSGALEALDLGQGRGELFGELRDLARQVGHLLPQASILGQQVVVRRSLGCLRLHEKVESQMARDVTSRRAASPQREGTPAPAGRGR